MKCYYFTVGHMSAGGHTDVSSYIDAYVDVTDLCGTSAPAMAFSMRFGVLDDKTPKIKQTLDRLVFISLRLRYHPGFDGPYMISLPEGITMEDLDKALHRMPRSEALRFLERFKLPPITAFDVTGESK